MSETCAITLEVNNKLIEKILENNDDADQLFELLNLDIHEIIESHLDSLSTEQLLTYI